MKRRRGMKHWIYWALVAVASIAHAQDIKGVRIGMTKDAYEKVMAEAGSFTIGGVFPMYAVTPEFDEHEKLTRFTMFFRSSDYADVREAVKTKYPKIRCIRSTVSNKFGATFPQEHCSFGNLLLSRLVSDIDTSVLSLNAPESERAKKEREQKKKDI
jgi:hypothetical protein